MREFFNITFLKLGSILWTRPPGDPYEYSTEYQYVKDFYFDFLRETLNLVRKYFSNTKVRE